MDADPYAGEFSRYIHLNSVRAGIAGEPEEYPWASYAAYIGKVQRQIAQGDRGAVCHRGIGCIAGEPAV